MAADKKTSEEKYNLKQFIVFKLADEEYAIPIEDVKEVNYTPVISKMPKTPAFIKGVANIRGDVIAIIDLETRFQIKPKLSLPTKNVARSFTMVIEAEEDYTVGFLTRGMPQSLAISESQIERNANIIKRAKIQSNFIVGLGKVDDRLIIILDINKILNDKEIQFLTDNKVE